MILLVYWNGGNGLWVRYVGLLKCIVDGFCGYWLDVGDRCGSYVY